MSNDLVLDGTLELTGGTFNISGGVVRFSPGDITSDRSLDADLTGTGEIVFDPTAGPSRLPRHVFTCRHR